MFCRSYPVFNGVRTEEVDLSTAGGHLGMEMRRVMCYPPGCGCRCNHSGLWSPHSKTKCRRELISL